MPAANNAAIIVSTATSVSHPECRALSPRSPRYTYPYLILDARYEKVREAGVIRSQAVLIAIGVDWEGRRNVLGVDLTNRESASSWKDFLLGLERRGLSGVEFVVSDEAQAGDRRGAAGRGLAALLRAFPAQRPGLRAACSPTMTLSGTDNDLVWWAQPEAGRSPAGG